MKSGDILERSCDATYHGVHFAAVFFDRDEYDPDCQTCMVRAMLAEHTHLHLGAGEPCTEPGINGVPGVSVKCSCGSFHH